MTLLNPEIYSTPAACRDTDSETLLAAYSEASRVYYTCGGHKLAARMENVMDVTSRELADRDIPLPTLRARLGRPVRCDANARRGTGTGVCGRILDEHGQCPNAANHL